MSPLSVPGWHQRLCSSPRSHPSHPALPTLHSYPRILIKGCRRRCKNSEGARTGQVSYRVLLWEGRRGAHVLNTYRQRLKPRAEGVDGGGGGGEHWVGSPVLQLVSESNSFRFIVIEIKFIYLAIQVTMLIVLEIWKYSMKNKITAHNPTTWHLQVSLSRASSTWKYCTYLGQ